MDLASLRSTIISEKHEHLASITLNSSLRLKQIPMSYTKKCHVKRMKGKNNKAMPNNKVHCLEKDEQGQEMSNRCVLFRRKILSHKLLRYTDIRI